MHEDTLSTGFAQLIVEEPFEGFSPSGSMKASHTGETHHPAGPFPTGPRLSNPGC